MLPTLFFIKVGPGPSAAAAGQLQIFRKPMPGVQLPASRNIQRVLISVKIGLFAVLFIMNNMNNNYKTAAIQIIAK